MADAEKPKLVLLRRKDPPPAEPAEPERVQIRCGCSSWPHFVWEALDSGWLVLTCTACGIAHLPTPKDYERAQLDNEFWPPDMEGE